MGGGTPSMRSNTRWAQMDQQRKELERRKQLYLEKQQNRSLQTQDSTSQETAKIPSLNAFSNDGSFLDRFKKMSESKNETKPKSNQTPQKYDDKKSDKYDYKKNSSSFRRSRDRSRSSSRDRDKKHERKNRYDKNNHRERNRHNKWDGRVSRKRSFSPCTPVVEDMPHRKPSRFANVPSSSSTHDPDIYNTPRIEKIDVPIPKDVPNPTRNLLNFPVFLDRISNGPVKNPLNIDPQPVTIPPTIDTRIPPPLNIPPPIVPNLLNPNFRPLPLPMDPNIPPYNENVPYNRSFPPPDITNRICTMIDPSIPPPPLMDSIPRIIPPTNIPLSDENFMSRVPLHSIPEPRPIDTVSIPPPKPIDTIAIPPPKPLDAITIPPPKPMNLQTIPPPLPICLTQIPKPKELDLCSIPHPPVSVLSTDGRLSTSMEAVAKQVAQKGDAWELSLKAQSTKADLWFLRDVKSVDYKMYRDLVKKYRDELNLNKQTVITVPEGEKYEPEFSLCDDSSSEDEQNKFDEKESNQNMTMSNPIKLRIEKNKNEHRDISSSTSTKFKNDLEDDSDSDSHVKLRKKDQKKRKSRWGDLSDKPSSVNSVGLPGVASVTTLGGIINVDPTLASALPQRSQPQLTKITRHDAGLVQYAIKTYGSVNLSDDDWKKCEDNYKISLLYQDMLNKRQEIQKLAASGRFKYEYDSDEEIDENGTWEHRLRQQEMEATQRWANELTKQATGKHHIGDFLPPDELKRFMEKYSSMKCGKEPDLSDYKEYKLKEDNIGFKMLQKLGWNEGEGLGADRSGIVDPVNKASQRDTSHGLGVERSDSLNKSDDEFDAYRKRMMLAYRFRPNPLNNPRRPYY